MRLRNREAESQKVEKERAEEPKGVDREKRGTNNNKRQACTLIIAGVRSSTCILQSSVPPLPVSKFPASSS
jgi:hypothetical protein